MYVDTRVGHSNSHSRTRNTETSDTQHVTQFDLDNPIAHSKYFPYFTNARGYLYDPYPIAPGMAPVTLYPIHQAEAPPAEAAPASEDPTK